MTTNDDINLKVIDASVGDLIRALHLRARTDIPAMTDYTTAFVALDSLHAVFQKAEDEAEARRLHIKQLFGSK